MAPQTISCTQPTTKILIVKHPTNRPRLLDLAFMERGCYSNDFKCISGTRHCKSLNASNPSGAKALNAHHNTTTSRRSAMDLSLAGSSHWHYPHSTMPASWFTKWQTPGLFFSQRKWLHSWSSVSTTSGTEVLLIWLKGTLPTNSHDIIAYRIFLKLQSVFLLLLEEQNSSLLYSPDLDTANLLIVKSGSQTATNLPRSLSLASSPLPSVPAPGWWRGGGSVGQRIPGCWH